MPRQRLDADDLEWERKANTANAERQQSRRPTCKTGKVVFVRESSANSVAQQMRKQYADPFIESYRCPECGYWHTGHAKGTHRQREKLLKMAEVRR